MPYERSLQLTSPVDIADGMRICVMCEGEASGTGGQIGNFLVLYACVIRAGAHRSFSKCSSGVLRPI
ncbi:hypothetical protein Acid7E03_41090 [Acidisoma sp. 7E03]